ncbi:CDP-glycerol glycerophosphotransferase, TagB/SpsB family [Virgibacillus subterraneus]|uniref:CDP-glycerol glycerophosphotransferase, TagB/SpsB family n=1 Tax=Virgibacillus subterraneus TaxID=621109 RepID=A0A1H9AEA0_9BACI|nr:CDP-glycerol glycerophosphotransferase, TagB/SpsB family [Virgibacillus subterraneus]
MVRELAITLYLSVFRTLFQILKMFPQKKKTTFVASFGDNILYTVNELEKQTDDQVVILKTSHCKISINDLSNRKILDFESINIIDWILSIYHLATSEKVIADNYYGFLAVTEFKPNVQCIQLWHAAGAIKQFGLKDPSIQNRSPRAFERFQKVYHRFDYVVVGSERMASIFRKSFNISNDQILRTGIPRSDFFFDAVAKNEAENSLKQDFPVINGKKVILYAPTYRDNDLNATDLHLNIEKMYREFKDDYVLFLRLHPAIDGEYQNKFPGFVVNVSSYHNMNHLLVISDILISDYSSIPFEYSLLNKPMVFYAYDLEDYAKIRGFWEVYDELVPGPVVKSTEDLIDVIKSGSFNMNRVSIFANQWNQYSNGYSSENLVKAIYTEEEQSKVADQV